MLRFPSFSHLNLLLLAAASLLLPALAQAEKATQPLELGTPFLDNMILQRGVDVPVWGWAEPGTEVTVAFAGQSRSAKAGEKGKWTLKLAPLHASAEEREFVVPAATGERFEAWPKSLAELATQLGERAAQN